MNQQSNPPAKEQVPVQTPQPSTVPGPGQDGKRITGPSTEGETVESPSKRQGGHEEDDGIPQG